MLMLNRKDALEYIRYRPIQPADFKKKLRTKIFCKKNNWNINIIKLILIIKHKNLKKI